MRITQNLLDISRKKEYFSGSKTERRKKSNHE